MRSMSAAGGAPDLGPASQDDRTRPLWWWVLAAVAVVGSGLIGRLFIAEGATLALWWPAAGVGAAVAMLMGRRGAFGAVGLVLVGTALANLLIGSAPLVALGLGIANAAETLVLVLVLGLHRRRFALDTLQQGVRLIVALFLAAVVAGSLIGLVQVLQRGLEWWPTASTIAASHAAAVAMIAPLAALPPRVPLRVGRLEVVVQMLAMALLVAVVFAPGSSLPLAFTVYPFLAWAALRFPIRIVLAESFAASLAMLLLTIAGGGPFVRPDLSIAEQGSLVETLLFTFSGLAIVLGSAQYELRHTARRLEASSRLLSGRLMDAQVGLAIAQIGQGAATLSWANDRGRALLVDELEGSQWRGPLLEAALGAADADDQVTLELDGRTIAVGANAIFEEPGALAIQLVDVTHVVQAVRAQQAQIEAEIEHEAARATRVELERQRDDFLATTSHELRTPITSIVGYTELLADTASVSDTERSWLDAIQRNALRLSELVEDLLTLSSAATEDRVRKRQQQLSCRELLEEAVAGVQVLAERKAQRIEVSAGDEEVLAVRHDLARAVVNLLANAVKFTPPGGSIAVSSHVEAGTVVLTVADTGPGMSDEALPHAFERFYRAPEAERDSIPGTGLGLAIVAELVRRNGGSASVRRNEAGGLTAELRLAEARAPIAAS